LLYYPIQQDFSEIRYSHSPWQLDSYRKISIATESEVAAADAFQAIEPFGFCKIGQNFIVYDASFH
jgi:hypothetical protein